MKKRLRILFLLDFFSFFGGTEYINYNMINGLKTQGHDVRVCVGEKLTYTTWKDMLEEIDVDLLVSESPYDPSDNLDSQYKFISSSVNETVKSYRPDLIFSHPPGKLLIAYLKEHRKSNIPVVAMEYTVPGENTKYWYHPELKAVQHRISAYIAKCEEAEIGLRKYYGYTGKVYRLPNLVAKPFKTLGSIKGELLEVGCVGRLSPEKGIGFLLGAWKQVITKHRQAKLHIYGHGLHEKYYQILTDDLGIRDSVIFEGTFQPIVGIDKIAEKHKIFVQPSLFESIPNSLIKLVLRKKAIVATNVGGIPELIRQANGEGFLVPPGSTDMLANAIIKLLSDEELVNTMAQKSYEHGISLYD